uniref:Uncharacterized protein n=1 Tax=Arundo donax TaxID=35708 RepID=A0A0A8YRA0_ARUDO
MNNQQMINPIKI